MADALDDYESVWNSFECNFRINDDEDDDATIAIRLAKSVKLKMCTLPEYDVPKEILQIEQSKKLLGGTTPKEIAEQLGQSSMLDKSTERGYANAFRRMLQFEEAAQSQYVIQFNTKDIQLERSDSGSEREFCIKNDSKVAALSEAVEESAVDCFTLKPSNALIWCPPISGQVKTSNKDFIFVEITERDHCDYLLKHPDRSYDIFFHVNRVTFQLQHYALQWMIEHQLFNRFVNSPTYDTHGWNFDEPATDKPGTDYTFRGTLGPELNAEQKLAAINIVQARNQPLPYLLFGPAGTGKTRTLVAAIEEIVRSTSHSVLVCANSNSACDEIVTRLIGVLREGEMFRMYGRSYDHRKVNANIKPICNWLKGEFRFPSLTFLYRFRVLVCTLTTSGCLTRATDNAGFNARHFSHVIIDESASTHETVSLIPIAGLCTSFGRVNSSIVLAGDPKQLDAVTKSDYAIQLGFKTSFMERLFEKQLYKRDEATDQYNPKYIAQLVKNYRSHPAILAIPNQLFYNNKLEAKASKDSTHLFIGSRLLPSKNFPIIFKSVRGYCKKSEKDFSMFNMKEVNVVIEYIKQLLTPGIISGMPITQSDIGVITPYKLQCKTIARLCRKNDLKDVTIGTAEVFQGQERPVMIVSTVRSDGQLGFVKSPRRLNVIITRAKALLIIVGDYNTLRTDSNWHKLAYYCQQNNAFIQ